MPRCPACGQLVRSHLAARDLERMLRRRRAFLLALALLVASALSLAVTLTDAYCQRR